MNAATTPGAAASFPELSGCAYFSPWRATVSYGVSFHTYRNVSSLAVATLRPLFRVARFNADRTLSLLSVNCANGTFSATPS